MTKKRPWGVLGRPWGHLVILRVVLGRTGYVLGILEKPGDDTQTRVSPGLPRFFPGSLRGSLGSSKVSLGSLQDSPLVVPGFPKVSIGYP